jgi:serine/threonine protein kinase
MKASRLPNRLMFLSPTVQAGWESESFRADFENLATLGQGSYGTVWKGRHRKTGAVYAIKEITKKTIGSQKMVEHVRTEVKVMYCLNHPNIVKLYNHFEDEFAIYFVLEFAERGELYKALLKNPERRFDEGTAARYVGQVAQAIQYIHRLNIIHRDIKPENILIGRDDELKLADFGWSNFTHEQDKRQTYCGTLDYLAPEMVDAQHLHDHRVDLWSLGVLIYELCTGSSPFSSQLAKTNALSEAAVKANITALNYSLPPDLSLACRDLISKILVLDPEQRPSIEAILSHPWLAKACKPSEEKEKWLGRLKHEFGAILESKEEEGRKFEAFSKEEIYNCSRLESVINGFKQKTGEQGEKRLRELELRVKELELCNKRQEEELRFLRNVKAEHQQCSLEISQARETNRQQSRKVEALTLKLQDYERILRDFDKSGR